MLGMGTRWYVTGLILFGILFLSSGTSAESQNENTSFNSSQAALEVGLSVTPMFQETRAIPKTLDMSNQKASLINGTGNLTKLVEVNNSAGAYAFVELKIVGTDTTNWSYLLQSSNTSDGCVASGIVQVENADKILLQGHAISRDQYVAYAGTGLPDELWSDAGRYSGNIGIEVQTDEYGTVALVTGDNEIGSIDHLCRSYHTIEPNSSEVSAPGVPGLEWNPSGGVRNESPAIFHYDHYAGDFLWVDHGTIGNYYGYAISGDNESFGHHQLREGSGTTIRVNSYGEEWPTENMNVHGNQSMEEVVAQDVTSLDHTGAAIYNKNLFGAYGLTKGTGKSISYKISPQTNPDDPFAYLEFAEGWTEASAVQQGTNKSAIPATMDGWVLGEFADNTAILSEDILLSGATTQRKAEGGTYNQHSVETGVNSNITAGKPRNSMSTSRINGVSKMVIDFTDANATSLDGRWMVDSVQGSPVSRSVEAVMPGRSAYISSNTYSGSRYIKDGAYYKSGSVDVQ